MLVAGGREGGRAATEASVGDNVTLTWVCKIEYYLL